MHGHLPTHPHPLFHDLQTPPYESYLKGGKWRSVLDLTAGATGVRGGVMEGKVTVFRERADHLWVCCLTAWLLREEGGDLGRVGVQSLGHQPVGPDLCPGPLSPVCRVTEESVRMLGYVLRVLLTRSFYCKACRRGFALIYRVSQFKINQLNVNQLFWTFVHIIR